MPRDASPTAPAANPSDRRNLLQLLFLSAVLLFNQLQNEVLYSVDGLAYALVGKELVHRPLSHWVLLTWHGVPFFEHPHLTPWLLALSMSVLGVSTFAALVPIALLSVATVHLTYRLGRLLLSHHFGMLAATVLALTPDFIRGGRNPMLEPALMLCIMLTVHFHVASTRDGRFRRATLLAGLSMLLALMAKGPPALLALAVIAVFQLAARVRPGAFPGFALTERQAAVQASALILIPVTGILLLDAWHRSVSGTSFLAQYIGHQLQFTVVEGRGEVDPQWFYYLRTLYRYWPWWPVALAAVGLVVWKQDYPALPPLVVGAAVTAGTYAGFTLMTHKSEWYVAIHYVGTSLLAALALRYAVSGRVLTQYYGRFVAVITIPILLLSASVPSVFLQYGRPLERFLDGARAELGDRLSGGVMADCVGIEPWRGPLALDFYLGVRGTTCDDASAGARLVDTRSYVVPANTRLLYSRHPFSILEGPGVH